MCFRIVECVYRRGAPSSRAREEYHGKEELQLVEYERLWRPQTTGPAQIRKRGPQKRGVAVIWGSQDKQGDLEKRLDKNQRGEEKVFEVEDGHRV